jgi:excisionase family DNA binding protein
MNKRSENRLELVADGLATLPEARKFLGVSRSTMYKLLVTGKLPSCKIMGARRVPWQALRQLAAACLTPAD